MEKLYDTNGGPYYICPICGNGDEGGIVVHIDDGDEDFWGCGDCGMVWFSEEDIGKELNTNETKRTL